MLGDAEQKPTAIPLDRLRPLQIVCSFEYKIGKRLHKLRDASRDPQIAKEKASLMGYRALLRNARADLEDKLRQRLHEVTGQIAEAREGIAKATLAVRVGDMSFTAFQQTVESLRQRRDRLERRRANLGGWLQTRDPFIAGGFVDLPYEEIPVQELEVSFEVDTSDAEPFLEGHLHQLKVALRDRDASRRKLDGSRRMADEDGLGETDARNLEKVEGAALVRAKARVEFVRGRLEQLIQDCENDSRAVRAHLEESQVQLERGMIDSTEFGVVEREMLRFQGEYNESRSLARQALKAENAGEVPQVRNSLVKRVTASAQNERVFSPDRLLAWISTAALGIATVLPLVVNQPGSNLYHFPFLVAGMLLGAIAFGGIALVADREFRGGGMLLVWMTVVLWSCVWLHSARLSELPIGGMMRTDPRWFVTPGLFTLTLSIVGMGLAASVTLSTSPRTRVMPLAAALVTLAAIALIFSDGAGLLSSRPMLGQPIIREATKSAGYTVSIPLRNEGRRPYWIGASLRDVPAPARFSLVRKVGETSSEDYTYRKNGTTAATLSGAPFAVGQMPKRMIEPGGSHTEHYTLPPGEYQVQLQPIGQANQQIVTRTFVLDPIEPQREDMAAPGTPVVPPETPDTAAPDPAQPQRVYCKLQGVLDSQGRNPIFSLLIETEDGRIINQRIELFGEVYGGWYASEYSPSAQSLTISDGENLLILERGNSVTIELSPPGRQ